MCIRDRAYTQFVEGGWTGLTASPDFGGQGLPHAIGVPLNEMVNAANLAWGCLLYTSRCV